MSREDLAAMATPADDDANLVKVCPLCLRRFRGPGQYDKPACEARAAVPAAAQAVLDKPKSNAGTRGRGRGPAPAWGRDTRRRGADDQGHDAPEVAP